MPVETDIYSTLGQNTPHFNALEMVGQFAQAQNALNQNKLFQLETGARLAIGDIMKGAMKEDGQIDYDKAAIDLSINPKTAWKAPEIINQWIQQQNVKAETLNKNLDYKIKQNTAYGDGAMSVLQYPDDQLLSKTLGKVGELVGTGMLDKDTAMAHISAMTQMAKDPKQLRQYLQGAALQSMGSAKAGEMVYGTLNNVEAGGYTSQRLISPMLGTSKEIAKVEKTPTAGERSTLGEAIDPDTLQTIQVPRQEQGPMFGGLGTPANKLTGGTSANRLTGSDGGGSLPAAGAQGGQPTSQDQSAAPQWKNVKSLAPGQQKYLEAAGGDVADMQKTLNSVVESGVGVSQNLKNAREALKHFKSGGGSEALLEMSRIAQAAGLDTLANRLAGGDRAAAQIFQKSVMGVVLPQLKQVMQGLGQMNMAEFDSILKANPNIETDPRAMDTLLGFAERQLKIAQGKQQGLARWTKAKKDPIQFEAAWQKYLQDKGISSVKSTKYPAELPNEE